MLRIKLKHKDQPIGAPDLKVTRLFLPFRSIDLHSHSFRLHTLTFGWVFTFTHSQVVQDQGLSLVKITFGYTATIHRDRRQQILVTETPIGYAYLHNKQSLTQQTVIHIYPNCKDIHSTLVQALTRNQPKVKTLPPGGGKKSARQFDLSHGILFKSIIYNTRINTGH